MHTTTTHPPRLGAVARTFRLLALALCTGAVLLANTAHAATLYLLTASGQLAVVDNARPTVLKSQTAITGLTAGDTLVALDVRPQNQALYALGANSTAGTVQLYHLSPQTAVATPIGTAGTFVDAGGSPVTLGGGATTWDIDYNSASDRLRVVNSLGQNFRMNPNTGASVDGDLGGGTNSVAGLNLDAPISGGTIGVNAAAHANNQPNFNFTTLYTLDGVTNSLFIQDLTQANGGSQTFVAALTLNGNPLDITNTASLDIPQGIVSGGPNAPVSSFGQGTMVAEVGGQTGLYGVFLTSGQAFLVGLIGDGTTPIVSSALRTDASPAIGLTANGASLLRFVANGPPTFAPAVSFPPGSITAGETLVGIDFRPQTGQLYGLGIDPFANTGTLYLIDPQTGAVAPAVAGTASAITFAGVDFPDPATVGYGFDFNPTVDRIRVVTGSGLNFRLSPNTGLPATAVPDGVINGVTTSASATAYTNSYGQSLSGGVTTQYTLDAATDSLYIQNPPNNGTQTSPLPVTLGGNPLDFTELGGFDIPNSVVVTTSAAAALGHGYFVATVGGTTSLYRLSLSTGEATLVGAVGAGTTPLAGLTVAVAPAVIVVYNPVNNFPVASGALTVAMGNTAIGGLTARTFQLRNFGTLPLIYSAALTTGTVFSVNSGGSGNLLTNALGDITVHFQPVATGAFTETVTITTNDPTQPTFQVLLSGTGVEPQEIEVEAPVGTPVQDGTGTLDFGSSLVGTPVTRQVKISNPGGVPLTYTTSFDIGVLYSVTANGSGTIAAGSSTTLTLSYTPNSGFVGNDTLKITSNDTSEPIFDLDLTGRGLVAEAGDVIVSGNGPTRFLPLANDSRNGPGTTITAVSDGAITIGSDGRTLIIPSGYTGTFTYTTSTSGAFSQGTVTVTAGTAATAPTKFNGILTGTTSKVAGWATTTLSAKGTGSTKVFYTNATGAVVSASATLKFPVGADVLAITTKAGVFNVDRKPGSVAGAFSVSFTPTGGTALTGLLHAHAPATAGLYTLEIASLANGFPGGGYAVATLAKSGSVKLKGVLPDGNPFSAGTNLTDVDTIAFFTALKKGLKPPGTLGGELTLNLTATTDLTGEFLWNKPPQAPTAKGTHLGGTTDNVLIARGSAFDKLLLLPTGNGTLMFSSDVNQDTETTPVVLTGGIPAPAGSLTVWKGPSKKGTSSTGLFTATLGLPLFATPVKVTGVYLQKSNRAWGYVPDPAVGGFIQLNVP